MNYSKEILPVEPNRVKRFYFGGHGIDKWQKIESIGSEKKYPEDLCINTSKYIGPGEVYDEGYSQVQLNGKLVRLKSLIESNLDEFLGKKYAKITKGEIGVSCRICDSRERLILQYHPTKEFARKEFGVNNGKTEAWYILGTRDEGEHYCNIGFKEGVTKEKFRKLFEEGDTIGMENCLHKVKVKVGDMVVIHSGLVHAIGPNLTCLEVHEACDYTMRLERTYAGHTFTDEELHYGLGFDKLFNGIDYTNYSDEEIEKIVRQEQKTIRSGNGFELKEILGYELCEAFMVQKLSLDNAKVKLKDIESHFNFVTAKGNVKVTVSGKTKIIPQGRGVFVPFNAAKEIEFSSENAEVIIAYPFQIN